MISVKAYFAETESDVFKVGVSRLSD